jgi:hypothetical protein
MFNSCFPFVSLYSEVNRSSLSLKKKIKTKLQFWIVFSPHFARTSKLINLHSEAYSTNESRNRKHMVLIFFVRKLICYLWPIWNPYCSFLSIFKGTFEHFLKKRHDHFLLTVYIYMCVCVVYLIFLIMFGKEYKLWSSSLCSVLQSPVHSSLFRPNIILGHAIAQAVSRWLPTAAARVQTRVQSCGICGGQSGAGADFLRILRFPLPIFILPIYPQSSSPIIRGWFSRPVVAAVPKVPPHKWKKKLASARSSQTPSVYVSPVISEIKFRTHTEPRAKLYLCIF